MKKIDKEVENNIIQEYKNGKSCRAIGEVYNISGATVFNILVRNNITKRTKGGIDPLPEDEIIELYKNGISSMKIAEQYNTTCNTILDCLKRNNIKIDNKYHNLTLNHNYFEDIDSYDKAYFLGFLMTDGSIGSTNNAISICLKADDYEILEILSNKIGNSNKLYYSARNEATMAFKSAKIKQYLSKHNVYPNKTYSTTMPKIRNDLMPHFIRGLIDGDGWISVKSHQIGFCGSETLVTQVRDYLANILGVYKVKVLHPEQNLWQITWASKKDINLIGEYIYKDKQDCYLQRKYKNFMEIPR